ncbi:helix-turn-helix domain-containing protein [Thermaerobacter litoralis]
MERVRHEVNQGSVATTGDSATTVTTSTPEALDRLPTLVPVRAVARKLGLNERTLYHYARTGVVGSYRLEGLVMLDLEEVAAWLQASYRPPKRSG